MTIRYIREHIYKTFGGRRYKHYAKANDKSQALKLASQLRDNGFLSRIQKTSEDPRVIYMYTIFKGPKA